MGSNKPFSRLLISQTIKVILCLFALIVAYLFALNGRYSYTGGLIYFDKWTNTMVKKHVEQEN